MLENMSSSNNFFAKFILKIFVLLLCFTLIINILLAGKENKFFLTKFYYPAISIEKNNLRNIISLRSDEKFISKKLKEFSKDNNVNIIEILNRSNSISYLLKKKTIKNLYNLTNEEILNILFNNSRMKKYFEISFSVLKSKDPNLFFHTKNMYFDDHNEKTFKQLERGTNIFNYSNFYNLISTRGYYLHLDERSYIKNFYRNKCPISRKIDSIILNCKIFPFELIDQNIEINFYL